MSPIEQLTQKTNEFLGVLPEQKKKKKRVTKPTKAQFKKYIAPQLKRAYKRGKSVGYSTGKRSATMGFLMRRRGF
jgi:hypothetical protein